MQRVLGLIVGAVLATSGLVVTSGAATAEEPPVATVSDEPPATSPAPICGNAAILDGPAEPPAGATVVAAGNNNSLFYDFRQPDRTFWFAPGIHTMDADPYGQIEPGSGTTFIGAPGAIFDGQGINRAAFTQGAPNVTIEHLTIRGFVAGQDQGVVNKDAARGWTVQNNTITDNGGAGLMAGRDNVYRENCIKDNGQYGINACCGGHSEVDDIADFVLDRNEIVGNNTDDWETQIPGCGCSGAVKFWINRNVTVTNNWVHDNRGVALWLDNNNRGFVIEHNLIEDNDDQALFIEAGYDARVRYNTMRRNAIVGGKKKADRGDTFPVGAIYVSESGSPAGYGLPTTPMVISDNDLIDNWGGVILWENPDRYCSSEAHTHPPFCTVKTDLYDDAQCETAVENDIPDTIDKYRCRWSTENIVVENNDFTIDKAAVGAGCVGAQYCGLNGVFSNWGSFDEFFGYTIPWRLTFQQGIVFRTNHYAGDWWFAGFQQTRPDGQRVSWADWTAPAPQVPPVFTHDNRPVTFGQDQGSTYN
ncbi:right-handed parallel beta-helix repeat-containing protein [Phytomonospora sp. NPDC050363]|uniref:right-handed parallel beta-helix repeat-containing protein n=1 Tax=Phytomonospora sp. NPDC050363 TaxID=3155642 RepID=UPI0034084A91